MTPKQPSWRSDKRSGSADKRWSGRKLVEWRKSILMREPLCRHCQEAGRVTLAQEIDHIIPLEDGGTYDSENAQPLCRACHVVKTAKDRGYKARSTFDVSGRVVW